MMDSIWLSMLGTEVQMSLRQYHGRIAISGSGSPLILLHGQGGHLENFRHNIAPLSARHRVYAPDCVWHGLGPQPPFDPELIPAYVEQVQAIMAAAELNSAAVLGQSMGAWTAMRLAIDHPELVSALILVNPQGMHLLEEREAPEILPAPGPDLAARHRTALDDPTEANVRHRLEGLFVDPTKLDDEAVAVRQSLYRMPVVNASLHRVLSAYMSGSEGAAYRHRVSQEELRSIACPTLLLWGEDNIIPPVAGERMVHELPNAVMCVAPSAGHWVHYEAPDWHNRQVEDFLCSLKS